MPVFHCFSIGIIVLPEVVYISSFVMDVMATPTRGMMEKVPSFGCAMTAVVMARNNVMMMFLFIFLSFLVVRFL